MGNLFSEYFLKEGILSTPDWENLDSEAATKIWNEIQKIVGSFEKRVAPDEADTETDLIEPILKLLGFEYARQKPLSHKRRSDVPDYVLFPDKEARERFILSERWNTAVAILEAKRWERRLDRGDRSDPLDPRTPSAQMLRYLSLAETISNGKIIWGILTNGRIWRLYYQRAISRIDGYVEFDLLEAAKDFKEFKRFYLIFRKEAFIPAPWRPHTTFLELALEEGKRWEIRVSQTLKDKIFTEIFPAIAHGFLHNAQQKGRRIDNDLLDEIYHGTLVFLYRLLFLFYAEDRDLMPVRLDGYYVYSLSRMRDEIETSFRKDEGILLSKKATSYYDRLRNLFNIIHSGDRSIGLPPYNGGLFDPSKHPFLENYAVPDFWLVPALDKLSRDYSELPPRRINYRDLSVRQLGSIYEGLLEFKLKVAERDLIVRRKNGREVYAPARDTGKVVLPKGSLYLTNDRSERKATGSYYTPDFVVQYIVQSSVEPYVNRFLKEFEEWWNELRSVRSKAELRKRLDEYKIPFDPKVYGENGKIIGEKSINEYRTALLQVKDPAQRLLSLKVLDPAMGSGHFLVVAVDYLADRILEILSETSEREYFEGVTYRSPLLDKLEEIRDKILKRAEAEGYYVDKGKLEDRNLIKRILLKRCIYGVDVNPLAVELAKVSLWLHTFTVGAPLSFLDHHLKCGNSLIGADPNEVRRVLGSSLMGQYFTRALSVVDTLQKLQELTDADISEVEESARLYEEANRSLSPLKKVLDLYTAEFFINPRLAQKCLKNNRRNNNRSKPWAWSIMEMRDPLKVVEGKIQTSNGEQEMSPEDLEKINKRLQIAYEKRFFHWKLEFPEVWYDKYREKVNGGFDVVLGNPPYIRIQEMRRSHTDEVDYYNLVFKSPQGSYDIYILFVEKGLTLLKEGGVLGFILPNKFTKLDFARKLREMIRPFLWKFVDFGDYQVFPEQTTYTGILFLRKPPAEDRQSVFMIARAPAELEDSLPEWLKKAENEMHPVPIPSLSGEPWILASKEEAEIMKKMESRSVPLGRIVEQIIVGIQTSADPIYILERPIESGTYYRVFSKALGKEVLLEKEILKPLISGKHIERYYVRMSNKLLLFPYKLLPGGGARLIEPEEFQQDYPKAWEYLKMHEKTLRNREGGKFDDSRWYRFGRIQNLDKHERRKFGVPRLCDRLKVFLDYKGKLYFDNVDVNGILLKENSEYSPYFLLATLNSEFMNWRFKMGSVPFKGNYFSANKQFLEPLPIPVISFKMRDDKVLENMKELYRKERNPMPLVRSLPPNSAVLHDFLGFLAQRMVDMHTLKYLLDMFILGRLRSGTRERIKVLKELTKHPDWEDGLSYEVQKEIAREISTQLKSEIERTDMLIDSIVYHVYGLSEKEVEIVKKS